MNTKEEILNSLSPAQKEEFEKDLNEMAGLILNQYVGNPDKVAETNVNMRLQNDVYLNLTVLFHKSEDGKVNAIIQELKRFKNVDEYLDAMNNSKNPSDGFQKLK